MSSSSCPSNSERKRSVRFHVDRNQSDLEQYQTPAGGRTDEYLTERSFQSSTPETYNTPQPASHRGPEDLVGGGNNNPYATHQMDTNQPEDSAAQYALYPPNERHRPSHQEVSPRTLSPPDASPSNSEAMAVHPGIFSSNSAVDKLLRECQAYKEGQRGSIGSWETCTLATSSLPGPTVPERTYGVYPRSSDDIYDARKAGEADMAHPARNPQMSQALSPPAPAPAYRGMPGFAQPQVVPLGSQEPTRPALRSALRNSHAQVGLARSETINRVNTAGLEEGDSTRVRSGVFTNLLKLYGMSGSSLHRRRTGRSQSQLSMATEASRGRDDSCDSMYFPTARNYGGDQIASRCTSTMSVGDMELLDPDDPRVTGARVNTIDQEKHAKDTIEPEANLDKRRKRQASIKYHISSVLARQTFILRLAKALMLFGSPSHRLESQLKATAVVLDVQAEFVHMPNIVVVSFGDFDTKTSQTHFIKVSGVLQLGRLHTVHKIYRNVVHDDVGVEEATAQLNQIMKAKPIFGTVSKTILAALCTGLICPMAFGGSFVDMLVAAGEGALLSYLQFGVASKNAMYSNVFEISVAIIMSFIARGLASIPSQIFCYSAISSAGIVLVLPGYMILCSALELASKNIVTGSVKLTFAIVYSLFLGFGLTIGSDLYLLLDSNARNAQVMATEGMNQVVINGRFAASNDSAIRNFAGSFTFTNGTSLSSPPNTIDGCYRDPNWPWYLQPFPIWSLAILVPAFSIFSSASNGQPLRSRQLPVMTVISCASFAANTAANHLIFNRSDVVSAIGAFVAGLLGNLYSRVTKTGTSFTSMVTGVLFLVPAGIAATGGLSQNYRGLDGDQYSNGLIIGLRTVQAFTIPLPLFPRLVQWYISKEKESSGLTVKTLEAVGSIRSALLGDEFRGDRSRWDTVLLGGLMGSLFSALQCIISPHLGHLSDKYGRKPVLLATMIGNVLSAVVWIQSTSFASFLLSRAIGGLSEGNVQLSIAIISDVTSQETRSRGLSLVGIAFAICFCIGPPIGAWFSTHPLPISAFHNLDLNVYATPALLSLVLLLVEIVLLVVALPETRQVATASAEGKQATSQDSSEAVKASATDRLSALHRLGRIHLLFLALFSGVEFTLTFLSFDLFDWNNAQNGRLLMTIGIVSALLQGGYVRRAKFAEAALARRGVFTCAVATGILATLPALAGGNASKERETSLLYVAAVFLAFTSATVVNALNAMASMQCDDAGVAAVHPDLAKGKALGRHRSAGQLGRAIGPLLACAAYWTVGPTITYGAGAIAMTALFASMRMDRTLSKGPQKKTA